MTLTPKHKRTPVLAALLAAAVVFGCDDEPSGGDTSGDMTATMDVPGDTQNVPDGTAADTSTGGCSTNDECTTTQFPYCSPDTGFCVECLNHDQCPLQAPICGTLGQCGPCEVDAQCAEIDPSWTCVSGVGACQECLGDDQCADPTPICSATRKCGECRDGFHCSNPALPTCVDNPNTGQGFCESHEFCINDDVRETTDDGPSGATNITPMGGVGGVTIDDGVLCSAPPLGENDWFVVDVVDGDNLTISVDWTAMMDIDLTVYDGEGLILGESWYSSPEVVTLTHLPAGEVYIALVRFDDQGGTDESLPYTLTIDLQPGGCTTSADCAAEYATQLYRGSCAPSGACERIDGAEALAVGEPCDSPNDCASGICTIGESSVVEDVLSVIWRFAGYMAGSDTRGVCSTTCASDAECTNGQVCTVLFGPDNHCVDPCTTNEECPVSIFDFPMAGEAWAHLTCNAGVCE